MKEKPRKIVYEDQEKIHDKIVNYIKSILPKEANESYLWESVVERNLEDMKKSTKATKEVTLMLL